MLVFGVVYLPLHNSVTHGVSVCVCVCLLVSHWETGMSVKAGVCP